MSTLHILAEAYFISAGLASLAVIASGIDGARVRNRR